MLLVPSDTPEEKEIPSYLDIAIMSLLVSGILRLIFGVIPVGILPAVVAIVFGAMASLRLRVARRSRASATAAGVEGGGEQLEGMAELDNRARQTSRWARLACVITMAMNVGMLVLTLLWKYILSSYF